MKGSNTNGTKLVWWLMGIFAAAILVLLSSSLATLTRIGDKMAAIEITLATTLEKQRHLEAIFRRDEDLEQAHQQQITDMHRRLDRAEVYLQSIALGDRKRK